MNVITRGMRNAFRSPLRSSAIIVMLAMSIGLVLAMLVARTSINQKITSVKGQTGTAVTINPAGIMGGMGGGTPLNSTQVATIRHTAHITSITASLTDQLGATDTNLTPSQALGSFGRRQLRFEQQGSTDITAPGMATRPTPVARIRVTGSSNPAALTASGSLTSGTMINGNSQDNVALIGSDLATKNNLTVGQTFTAYGTTITIKGIYTLKNTFQDSGLIMPLATVQTLSDQAGAVSSVDATVDSADNVASVVNNLKTTLGSAADITSEQQQAEESVASLKGIANLALYGVIGAAIAGAVIVLLSMIIIVRERRREIGIIKAIGGTNKGIVMQFMAEALTLTVIGGLVGLAFGVLVSGPMTTSLVTSQNASSPATPGKLRAGNPGGQRFAGLRSLQTSGMQVKNNFKSITTTLTPGEFLLSILSILVIAIVGSAVPAWLIARIRPAEVLRSE